MSSKRPGCYDSRMQLEVFHYRDYVPALVITAEAGRIDDFLHAESEAAGHAASGVTANDVVSGLNRLVADIQRRGITQENLDSIRSDVQEDLRQSKEHERAFESLLRQTKKQLREIRGFPRSAEVGSILRSINALIATTEAELTTSRRVSIAYRKTLTDLSQITPKVLTEEEQRTVEMIDQRIDELNEFQRRLKENPADAPQLVRDLTEGRLLSPNQQTGTSDLSREMRANPEDIATPAFEPPFRTKTARRRLDERSALSLAGALTLAVPSFVLSGAPAALVLGTAGLLAGLALYPALEQRL